jgi:multisubunit Na+/H+ antiporter MnhE subunit
LLGRAAYLAGQTPGLVHDDLAAAAPPGAPLVRPRRPARFSLLRIGLVTVVWVLLWRDPAPGVWAGGVLVAGLIEIGRGGGSRHALMRPGGLLRFVARYMVRVIKSNLEVAWEVITPSNDRIREAIVAVPLDVESPAIALLVANAVSFTPGTLTVELTANPLVVYVHVLHFESAAAVRREVAGLADLAAHAFVQSVGR